MTDDPITLPPPGELETWPMACDEDVKAYALAAVLADRAEREGPTLPGPEGPTIPADEGPDDDQRKGGPPEVTRAMLLAAEGIFRKNGVEFSPCLAGEVWRAMQAARAAAPAVWGKRYKNLPELMTLWKTGRMTGDEAMAELFKHLSSDPCAAAPAKGGSREAAWRAFAGEYEQVERLRAQIETMRHDDWGSLRREDSLIALAERLDRLIVGGCTCDTKTPELAYHNDTCTYRVAVEVGDALREAHERLEGAYGSIREHMEALREAHATIDSMRNDDWGSLRREVERLRALLRAVMDCDGLTGWCGPDASPLYDRIDAELGEKP